LYQFLKHWLTSESIADENFSFFKKNDQEEIMEIDDEVAE
jgi:hypothetical protein